LPTDAYLAQALTPAQLALVPAGGLSIGYSGQDFGPSVRSIQNELIRVHTGLKGHFGDKWKWDASYLFGQNTSHVAISNTFKAANFRNALDAVSVGGQIVAAAPPRWRQAAFRSTFWARPMFQQRPPAIFWARHRSGKTGLHDLSANIQGEPFSTWAGPVSIGVGAEYRRNRCA
jgi:hypothetical protein